MRHTGWNPNAASGWTKPRSCVRLQDRKTGIQTGQLGFLVDVGLHLAEGRLREVPGSDSKLFEQLWQV